MKFGKAYTPKAPCELQKEKNVAKIEMRNDNNLANTQTSDKGDSRMEEISQRAPLQAKSEETVPTLENKEGVPKGNEEVQPASE